MIGFTHDPLHRAIRGLIPWLLAAVLACGDEPDLVQNPPTPVESAERTPPTEQPPPSMEPYGVPAERVDEAGGQLVAADHLLVLLEEGRDRSVVEAAAASVQAEVVGQVPQVGLYQLRLRGASPEALEEASERLRQVPGIESVGRDPIVPMD